MTNEVVLQGSGSDPSLRSMRNVAGEIAGARFLSASETETETDPEPDACVETVVFLDDAPMAELEIPERERLPLIADDLILADIC